VTPTVREYRRSRVDVAGGAYCVHEWIDPREGDDQKTLPIMLLHGFTGSGLTWERPVSFGSRFARAIAPDLPGHGQTSVERCNEAFSFTGVRDAFMRLLDAASIDRCLLHGYSMGGRLALFCAMTRPSRIAGLSLESASAGLSSEDDRDARRVEDEELAAFVIDHGIEAFVDRWERTPVLTSLSRLPAEARERLRSIRVSNAPAGLAASLRGMGTGAQPYLGNRLSELAMPVLAMAGVMDERFSRIGRELTAAIPNARFVSIADCGHTPHLEQPERWARALDAFLAEVVS
jgi:2-succinyl-6-hydroxy-2,4-cyclohexadiene-1-carboxylate synthase